MQISRRINQTGRKKIHRSDVTINLVEHKNGKPGFTAAFRLDDSLPKEAAVYVEAYNSNTLQRFSFGTAGYPAAPEKTVLDQLDLSSQVRFRVKVVDESGPAGKLIASAEGLRSEEDSEEEHRASLMVFKSSELGSLTWKIECSDDSKPVLYMNNKIPASKETLLHNPVFRGLILPGALREVLMSILLDLDDDPVDGSWQERWLNFAEEISPSGLGGRQEERDHMWVNEVADAFSDDFRLCERLVSHMEKK